MPAPPPKTIPIAPGLGLALAGARLARRKLRQAYAILHGDARRDELVDASRPHQALLQQVARGALITGPQSRPR